MISSSKRSLPHSDQKQQSSNNPHSNQYLGFIKNGKPNNNKNTTDYAGEWLLTSSDIQQILNFSKKMQSELHPLPTLYGPAIYDSNTNHLWRFIAIFNIPNNKFIIQLITPGVGNNNLLSNKNQLQIKCVQLQFEDMAYFNCISQYEFPLQQILDHFQLEIPTYESSSMNNNAFQSSMNDNKNMAQFRFSSMIDTCIQSDEETEQNNTKIQQKSIQKNNKPLMIKYEISLYQQLVKHSNINWKHSNLNQQWTAPSTFGMMSNMNINADEYHSIDIELPITHSHSPSNIQKYILEKWEIQNLSQMMNGMNVDRISPIYNDKYTNMQWFLIFSAEGYSGDEKQFRLQIYCYNKYITEYDCNLNTIQYAYEIHCPQLMLYEHKISNAVLDGTDNTLFKCSSIVIKPQRSNILLSENSVTFYFYLSVRSMMNCNDDRMAMNVMPIILKKIHSKDEVIDNRRLKQLEIQMQTMLLAMSNITKQIMKLRHKNVVSEKNARIALPFVNVNSKKSNYKRNENESKESGVNGGVCDDDIAQMFSWLENIVGLVEYFDVFTNAGYSSMRAISKLTEKDLSDIGVQNKEHRKLFVAEIDKL